MIVERLVSTLEMTDPNQLSPPNRTGPVGLTRWSDSAEQLKILHDEIAAPHRWPTLTRTERQWSQQLSDPGIAVFDIAGDGRAVGLVEIEAQPDRQVEITIFGLRPAFQGRGLGGAALTLAVRAAWHMTLPGGRPVRRVWLHTSTRDGSGALTNYLRRGFVVVSTETKFENLSE